VIERDEGEQRRLLVARDQRRRVRATRRDQPGAALAAARQARRGARPALPVYAWFTEGAGTRDRVEAKALLEDLAR